MVHQVAFLFLITVVQGLKVKYENVQESNDVCSKFSDEHLKPWRARAICEGGEVELLNRYLSVSRSFTESLELEEMENQKKGRRKGRRGRNGKKGRRVGKGRGKNGNSNGDSGGTATVIEDAPPSTRVFRGKFCAAGVKSGGDAIATSTYGYKVGNSTVDTVFKVGTATAERCYTNTCSGRCDQVDESVKFECVSNGVETDPTKFSSLKASWFIDDFCKNSSTSEINDQNKTIVTSLDGYYTYSAAQVAILNSGTQDRYCWGMGGVTGTAGGTNPEWNNEAIANARKAANQTDYYYSYSSSQLLPVCPR